MWDFFTRLFDTTGFPPRWTCGEAWDLQPGLGYLHIAADVATFGAYFAVPLVVAYFVIGQSNVRLPRVFWWFLGLIFFSCGLVHLIEAAIFVWPVYRLSALVKLITAVVSCAGVVILARVLPRALTLKTQEELDQHVSERRKAEVDLEHERYLLHTLLEHLPDAIYFKDKEGRFTRIGRSLAQRLGLNHPVEAVGKSDVDFFPRPYAQAAREDERTVLQTGQKLVGKEENPTWPNGESQWMLTTKVPLINRDGSTIGICGISHDFTRQKKTEQALRSSEERFALAVRGSSDGLWDWNVATDEVYFSPRFKELIGYADDEMNNVFSAWESKLHPDDREVTLAAVHDHLDQQAPYDVEYRLKTKSGDYRWFRARGQAVWDSSGRPIRMAGSLTDVTDQKAAEETLQERANLSALTADIGLALTQTTDLRKILQRCTESLVKYLNAAFARIWKLNEHDQMLELIASAGAYTHLDGSHSRIPVGQYKIGLIAQQRKPHLTNDVIGDPRVTDQEWAQREGMIAFAGYPLMLGDRLMGVMALFSRHRLSQETINAMATLANAIALGIQRKRMELALQEAKEAAETANQAKSNFLANMSHEIRTPMNAIIGLTELTLETGLTPQQQDYLTTVLDSAESLLTIINEILDFSKIEARKIELEIAPFRIRELLGDTLKTLGLRAHDKNLELAYCIDSNVPDQLVGDPVRLRQIVVNLVGNAIKFTERGEVILNVKSRSRSEENVELHFSIRDTGIGIPEEKITKVFHAFEQGDTSTTRQFGGTGLGLAIASTLVKMMNGDIWVVSEFGRGSDFQFTATFGLGEEVESETTGLEIDSLFGMPMLVVDDNRTNRRILRDMLGNWGLNVQAVESGPAALALMRERAANDPFRLVLTDVNMPEMDGFMLAERIRQDKALAETNLIILTSGGRSGDLQRGERLGVSAQLMKPVKQSELLDAILSAVGTALPQSTAPTAPLAEEAMELPSLHILLAEDGIANQKLAVGLLTRWGHTVKVAANGREALDLLDKESFDLILMDVQMPELDGFEATKKIRERERDGASHIPIIAMTARAMKGDREQCLAAGMDGYVSKPVRREELSEAIAKFFSNSHATRAETEVNESTAAEDEIDWSSALESVGGDKAFLKELVASVLHECPSLLNQLREAIRQREAQTVQRAAHTLKGTLRLFNVRALYDLALELELKGRNGDLDDVSELYDRLKAKYQSIEPRLRSVLND